MKQISLERAKQIQLEILVYFDNFCRKNDIKYSLADGTLLGAIRHKGFIPWDDDIDVMLLRSEFDKFVKLYGDGDRYKFTNRNYGNMYGLQYRLCDSYSLLDFYSPFKCKLSHGIFIDIIPIDNYPDSEEERREQQNDIRRFGTKARIMCSKWKYLFTDSIGRKTLLERLLLSFTTMHYWRDKAQDAMRRYNDRETTMLAEMEFWRHQPWVFPKETFSSYVDIEFEGKSFMSIKNYDIFLTAQYGDYMKLPPIEKQIPHHDFNAYWLRPESIDDLKNELFHAMHGGGRYFGKNQSNSKDAFEYWRKEGKSIFEFDLAVSDDNKVVALAHHLNKRDLEKVEVFEQPPQYTKEWFMSKKLYSMTTSGMEPLSLQTIIEAMRKDNQLIVMLDLYGMFSKEQSTLFAYNLKECIGDDLSLYKRILVEVYCREMIDGITSLEPNISMIYGIDYGISLFYKDVNNQITPSELSNYDIKYVSYPLRYQKEHPMEMESFRENGFCIFSRTESNLHNRKLRKLGVSVNLIDIYYKGIEYVLHKIYACIGVDYLKQRTESYRIRNQIRKNRRNYEKSHHCGSL